MGIDRCHCNGKLKHPLRTTHKDELGDEITIDQCPVAMLSRKNLHLIKLVLIFFEFNVLPEDGGQDIQPYWFFEVARVVKSFYAKQQAEESKNASS